MEEKFYNSEEREDMKHLSQEVKQSIYLGNRGFLDNPDDPLEVVVVNLK